MPNTTNPGEGSSKKPTSLRRARHKPLAPVVKLVHCRRDEELKALKSLTSRVFGQVADGKIAGLTVLFEYHDGTLFHESAGLYGRDTARLVGLLHTLTIRLSDRLGG